MIMGSQKLLAFPQHLYIAERLWRRTTACPGCMHASVHKLRHFIVLHSFRGSATLYVQADKDGITVVCELAGVQRDEFDKAQKALIKWQVRSLPAEPVMLANDISCLGAGQKNYVCTYCCCL